MTGKPPARCRIISPIGKGGIAEAYQAQDRKPGLDGEIRVLPEEFAKAPEPV